MHDQHIKAKKKLISSIYLPHLGKKAETNFTSVLAHYLSMYQTEWGGNFGVRSPKLKPEIEGKISVKYSWAVLLLAAVLLCFVHCTLCISRRSMPDSRSTFEARVFISLLIQDRDYNGYRRQRECHYLLLMFARQRCWLPCGMVWKASSSFSAINARFCMSTLFPSDWIFRMVALTDEYPVCFFFYHHLSTFFFFHFEIDHYAIFQLLSRNVWL